MATKIKNIHELSIPVSSQVERLSNNAITSLIGSINSTQTLIKVASNTNFPPSPQFRIKIDNEIMLVTSGTDSINWTVVRGIEQTTKANHSTGSKVCQVLTKSALTRIIRGEVSFGTDNGSVNAFEVDLYPPVEEYYAGLTVNFKALTANDGPCTIDLNSLGAVVIKKRFNVDLVAGDILAGQIISLIFDGSVFQMSSSAASVGSSGDSVSNEVEIPDNSTDTFVLSTNFVAGTTKVYLNGLRQRIGTDYIEQGTNEIVFSVPPYVNDYVIVDFQKSL